MRIDLEQARQIAALAELEISDEALMELLPQFDAILEYVARLDALPVAEVPPTFHGLPEPATPLRPDETRESLPADEALRNAPAAEQSHFAVPRVLKEPGQS